MENSRISRKLGVNAASINTIKNSVPAEVEVASDVQKNSKPDLKSIFQTEIDDLVRIEIEVQKKAFTKELQEKFDHQLKKLENEYHQKSKKIAEQEQALYQLIASVTAKYKEEASNNITQLDGVLIEMVMEALYKILGEKEAYEKSIAKIVKTLATKQLTNTKVSMKVSEESFHLLSKLYKDNSILSCIQLDNSLAVGQVRIDDGISIIAIGLIDQLDYLKNILIAQLREIHGL